MAVKNFENGGVGRYINSAISNEVANQLRFAAFTYFFRKWRHE